MKIKEVKKLPTLERYVYFVGEREKVRLKKKAKRPKPWTDDEILQNHRFCNVRRMDDKVSQWLLKNWYTPYKDHRNILFACIVARVFNKPETLTDIGFPKKFDPEHIVRKLKSRKARNLRNFNGAYIVSTNGMTGDKVSILTKHLLTPASYFTLGPSQHSLEVLAGDLTSLWGINTFMAGQVVADVRWATSRRWVDRNRWAYIGPGSRRGLNRLLGNEDIRSKISQDHFVDELQELRKLLKDQLPEIEKRLEAIDIQNTLCEFDKYERTLWGQGRPKQRYKGMK